MRRLLPTAVAAALLTTSAAVAAPSAFETEVFDELNYFREDPADYGNELRPYLSRFEGKLLIAEEGEDVDIMTNEGAPAVSEAIRALRSERPLPPLIWSNQLQRAAADQVALQSRTGGVGHYNDGRGPGDRMRARGGGPYVSEVITYGHNTPASVIHQLLIDDGVPGRGHRFSLLRTDPRYAGVACGTHRVYRTMCVIVMSQTVDGSAPPPPKRPQQ